MSTLRVDNIQDLAGQEKFDIVLGTAKTATGTAVDFTGIPSWANRVDVMFNGVSTTGTSGILVILGDSGGFESSGYTGAGGGIANAGTGTFTNNSSGFFVLSDGAAVVSTLAMTLRRFNGNTWIASYTGARDVSAVALLGGGAKTLSDPLTSVRISVVSGGDAFDAGSFNVSWE